MVRPQAGVLPGVTMRTLTRRLDGLGALRLTKKIRRGELDETAGAAPVGPDESQPVVGFGPLGEQGRFWSNSCGAPVLCDR
ncbi:hypothetical protein ACIO87_29785 [Streptomyces sp. NPDC087218]|uniref:hypothetical protein n=1 Tax=Streptomyces sp. NPDC087218 TaxID=3365769 RepID=UPI00380D25A9